MRNIMIVEDDDDIREVLETVLEDEGFSVSGFEGISVAQTALKTGSEKPDLILLDFMFPTGNSGEFLASLREHFQKLPVILMSAGNDFIVGGNVARAHGFISKPIQIDLLLQEIARVSSAVSLAPGR